MFFPRLRFYVASGLFLAWLGWLGYLALTASNPIVLSRAQLLVASAHLIAEVPGTMEHPEGKATIAEITWAPGKQELKEGNSLTIVGLAECGPEQGWRGPGKYILAISKTQQGVYALTLTPHSPGYPAGNQNLLNRLRIYPETQNTRRQLELIEKQNQSS